jgi:biopolymer transport protein ExbD
MSHGGGGGDDEIAEPNLTPLLDLVLQLVMFFMITTSFVMEQLNANIQLPEATSAKPIDREAKNIIFLNVDQDGQLLPLGEPTPLRSLVEINGFMQQEYERQKANRGEEGLKDVTVVIRGSKDTDFEHIYNVMLAAKTHKFSNIQLRANVPGGGTPR